METIKSEGQPMDTNLHPEEPAFRERQDMESFQESMSEFDLLQECRTSEDIMEDVIIDGFLPQRESSCVLDTDQWEMEYCNAWDIGDPEEPAFRERQDRESFKESMSEFDLLQECRTSEHGMEDVIIDGFLPQRESSCVLDTDQWELEYCNAWDIGDPDSGSRDNERLMGRVYCSCGLLQWKCDLYNAQRNDTDEEEGDSSDYEPSLGDLVSLLSDAELHVLSHIYDWRCAEHDIDFNYEDFPLTDIL